MSPLPAVSSYASASGIRYEIVGEQPSDGHPERFILELSADGHAKLNHEHGPMRQSWSARTEGIVWPRLLEAVENVPCEGASGSGSHHQPGERTLQVFGVTPSPRTVAWESGRLPAQCGAILDSLIAQVSGLSSRLVHNALPPLTHRAGRHEPAVDGASSGQEPAAVFGTVKGRPAFALAQNGGGFSVFSADPLRTLGETTASGQPIRALALGSDGDRDLLVTGGDDSTVWAWDLTGDGGLLHARGGHGGAIRALASRTDQDDAGLVYSGGVDGNVWAWDSRDGTEVGALTGHDRTVNALATAEVGGVGLLVSGGDDGKVRVWNTDTGESLRAFALETQWVNAVAIAGTEGWGLIAAAGSDHTVRVWDLASGTPTQVLRGHNAAVTGLAFLDLADCAVLASCSYDGTIRTWDVAAGRALNEWSAQDSWPTALAAVATSDGVVLVSGGETGTVRVWDARGTALRTLSADDGPIQALAMADLDGKAVAAVGHLDGSLRLWDVATGSVRHTFAPDDGPITSVAFGSAASTVVCGTAQGTLRIHSTRDGTLLLVPTPHTNGVLALAFLPGANGVVASAGVDQTVRTWEAGTGRPLLRLRGHRARVHRLAAGQIGKGAVLASADEDGTILVWDAVTGRRLMDFRTSHPASALVFAVVDNVNILVAAEPHGFIRVWDADTGDELTALETRDAVAVTLAVGVLHGAFVLLAGTQDARIRAWRLLDGEELGEVSITQTPLALSLPSPGTLYVAGSGGLTTIDQFTP